MPTSGVFTQPKVLVAGNYCHDLILREGQSVDLLGGSVAYITAVLDAVGLQSVVTAKVGIDFKYLDVVKHLPLVISGAKTTAFIIDFRQGVERHLRAEHICEAIQPEDLPSGEIFDVALAAGVAQEIDPVIFQRLAQLSRRIIVDIQALVRSIDRTSGEISLLRLEETPFYELLSPSCILKASKLEAESLDIRKCSQVCEAVIVTDGARGSQVFTRHGDFVVAAYKIVEMDSTGAGDAFLGGLSAGLARGLSLRQAVSLGSYFGAQTAAQLGVPLLAPFASCDWDTLMGSNGFSHE
eukprot:jgi/Mesen1/4828/ME000243S04005